MTKDLVASGYKSSLLRNFTVKQLERYFETQINDFKQLLRKVKIDGSTSHERFTKVLNELTVKGFNDNNIDQDLFNGLVYYLSDRVYHMNLNTSLGIDEAFNLLNESSKYSNYINKKLSKVATNDSLITIRREGERLIFLFQLEVIELGGDSQKSNFYISCILDFEDKYIQIRLRHHYLKSSKFNLTKVIKHIVGFLSRLPIATSVGKYNEAFIQQSLYKMFLKESEKSLNLIKKEVAKEEKQNNVKGEEELREDISNYLKQQLNISDPTSYVDKVMSVKYQDTVKQIKEKDFVNDGGFIFAFSFIDRKITRSTNRNKDHKPVYYSKIYWNLRDVVKDYEEISELGVYWKFNNTNFGKPLSIDDKSSDLSFAEVGFKEIHSALEIHYYTNSSDENLVTLTNERRLRERYVVWKIRKFI